MESFLGPWTAAFVAVDIPNLELGSGEGVWDERPDSLVTNEIGLFAPA